jgi:predicted peroxiredoxin|uniref:DsrE family protein n=1 Tax=Candidatus Planktophila sp. TaxID=2175601 RepID=UPI00404A0512
MSRTSNLVIKLTCGLESPERVSQAISVASAALASGVKVSFWLTGDAAYFALPGKAATFELPHAAPLEDQLSALVAGARVVLCSQCAVRRNINDGDQIKGIVIEGAASFVEEITRESTQAIVY